MRNYEERAKDFIEKIRPFIADCKTMNQYCNAVKRFNRKYNRKVIVSSGATRIAFITSDYVVKFDYNGAGAGTFGDCESEARLYRKAEEEGFEHLLAKITPYNPKNAKKTFYIMPRINNVGKTPYSADFYLTGDEYCWVNDHIGDLHRFNYGWKNKHIVIIDYAYNCYTYNF